jgi:8-oxo-dGTP pyrophosphatase MutT (NUDIX family)
MPFIDRIRVCHAWDPAAYVPFIVGEDAVGFVHDDFAVALSHHGDVFSVDDDGVRLQPHLLSAAARSEAVDRVVRRLAEDGWVRGWRGEAYPVWSSDFKRVLFKMERAVAPRFGIPAWGVHVNGVVQRSDGLHMWIGRRSATKHTAPLKLDQIVAGGVAAGFGVRETLIKEAEEEAGMPVALAETARPAGVVRYRTEREEGLRNDILFVFDIDLPPDFMPVCRDGEIEEFYLYPIQRVVDVVRDSDEFKFNCALVVIDFLVRKGLIGPEEQDYLDICAGLHMP